MVPFLGSLSQACLEKQLQGPNSAVCTPTALPLWLFPASRAASPNIDSFAVRPKEEGQVAAGSGSVVGTPRELRHRSVAHQAAPNPGTFFFHALHGCLLPMRGDVISK